MLCTMLAIGAGDLFPSAAPCTSRSPLGYCQDSPASPSQRDVSPGLIDGGDVERGGILRHGGRFSRQCVSRFVPGYPAVGGGSLHVDGAVFNGLSRALVQSQTSALCREHCSVGSSGSAARVDLESVQMTTWLTRSRGTPSRWSGAVRSRAGRFFSESKFRKWHGVKICCFRLPNLPVPA